MDKNRISANRDAKRVVTITALVVSLFVVGCAETLGAGAGAVVGNQFGQGSGKTAATIGGAVGGAIIGHELSK
ncbi:MAG: glycine zipper 2TM domain-containing protein [Alphaproteobacteria bacterium]